MMCAKGINFTYVSFSQKDNLYHLKIKSKLACPTEELSAIWDFYNAYKWFFIIIIVVLGIVECFFGRRLLNTTFLITGFGTGSSICSVYLLY